MKLVLVDTSAWIDFFRHQHGKCSKKFLHLLDEEQVALASPICLELLAGASKSDGRKLQRLFQALPLLTPLEAHWQQAEDWAIAGAAKGHHFGMGDLIIAAVAGVDGLPLWSLDKDFIYMERLGFIRLLKN